MKPATVLVVLFLFASSLARAQNGPPADKGGPEQVARELYAQGEAAFKAGQYDEALTAFEAGFAAVPRAGFVLNIGHVYRKIGKLRNARAAYKKYLLMEPDSKFRANVLAVIAEIDSALAEEDQAEAAAAAPADSPANPVTLAAPAPAPSPNPAAPLLIATRPAPAGEADAARAPFYRRPWFWIAAAAVVTGTAAGIYLIERPGTGGFQSSGTLGSLGP